MFFELVRLRKCHRLSKPNITIRPTKRIQQVLGTNGCGKSSLLSIGFSPLPANHNDFDLGGGREVHIYRHGRRYILEERFDADKYYSFIVDEVEKNDGHTITAQLELVKEHFNYSREIHEFVTGKIQFTKLSPNERRDWIALMSEADFSFAFREFDRYRKGHSAAVTITKFLKNRINEETVRLINPEDAAAMRARATQLKQEIRELMSFPRIDSPNFTLADLKDEYNALFIGFDSFCRKEYPRTLEGGKDWDDLVSDLTNRTASLEAVREERGSNLSTLNNRLERIKGLMAHDPAVLSEEQATHKAALADIPGARIDIHPSMLVRSDIVVQALREAVAELPAERTTHAKLMEISNELQNKQIAFSKADNLLNSIAERLHQIDRCESIQCPSCDHAFKPGINPAEMDELKTRQTSGLGFVKTVGDSVKVLLTEYEVANENYSAYEKLEVVRKRYAQQYPGIFSYIDSVGGFDVGRGLYEKIALYEREVALHERREVLTKRIDTIQMTLESYERESEGFMQLKEERDALFKSYRQVFEECAVVDLELKGVKADRAYESDYITAYQTADVRVDVWTKKLTHYLDHEAALMAEEEIARLQTTLAINETALAEDDLISTVVKDLQAQLEKNIIAEEAYRRLADAMSPKTGLIAEQITQQIGAIIGGVNQTLKRIWAHPLYINLPDHDKVGLDYKFPIVDEARQRKDIAVGSDSMLEVVNRAFVITLYYCLNLRDYPLFLDEPGRTFDEAHAHNLIPLIKDLVDSDRFSQVLIISHDPDNQTAFPDSETIIIDDRNVSYRHTHNEHVEFTE